MNTMTCYECGGQAEWDGDVLRCPFCAARKASTHPHASEIVAAIRADTIVGRNSCSVIDECYGDDELVETFGWFLRFDDEFNRVRGRRRSVRQAVAAARQSHRIWADHEHEMSSIR